MLKPLGWNDELGDGWDNMLLDFRLLAWDALPCPLANILLDVRPDKLVRDGLPRPLDSGMSEAVDHVEYSSTVRQRNKGAGRTVRYIDEEVS